MRLSPRKNVFSLTCPFALRLNQDVCKRFSDSGHGLVFSTGVLLFLFLFGRFLQREGNSPPTAKRIPRHEARRGDSTGRGVEP